MSCVIFTPLPKSRRGASFFGLHHLGEKLLLFLSSYPFIPPSSSRVRVRVFLSVCSYLCVRVFVRSSLPMCLRVRGARAPRLLGVRVLVLGGRHSVLVFFGIRHLRLRLHVHSRVRCSLLHYLFLPHATRSFHLSFVLNTRVRACVLLVSLPL